jgi:hypothetical protein
MSTSSHHSSFCR